MRVSTTPINYFDTNTVPTQQYHINIKFKYMHLKVCQLYEVIDTTKIRPEDQGTHNRNTYDIVTLRVPVLTGYNKYKQAIIYVPWIYTRFVLGTLRHFNVCF